MLILIFLYIPEFTFKYYSTEDQTKIYINDWDYKKISPDLVYV